MGAKALNSDSFSGAGGHAGGYQIDLLVQGYPGKSVCHGSLGWSTIALLRGLTKRDIGYIAGTVLPMFAIMMLAIVLIYFFPGIVLWLPSLM